MESPPRDDVDGQELSTFAVGLPGEDLQFVAGRHLVVQGRKRYELRRAAQTHKHRLVAHETGPAEANTGAQEMRTEPVVEAHALRNIDNIGADELAHIRDLVDEADPRREEGVGRELDELGRGDVDAEKLGLDPLV